MTQDVLMTTTDSTEMAALLDRGTASVSWRKGDNCARQILSSVTSATMLRAVFGAFRSRSRKAVREFVILAAAASMPVTAAMMDRGSITGKSREIS